MSSLVSLKTTNNEFTGKLVITKYGLRRILERIQNAFDYVPINIAQIGIGNKLTNSYDSSVTRLKNEIATFEVKPEDITITNDVCTIRSDVVITEGISMKEIGIYDVIRNQRYLFAYASGFNMVANEQLSYNLVIDLALKEMFQDIDYRRYGVSVGSVEPAYHSDIVDLYNCLSSVQLDLERCIQANSNKLGYNKAEVFYKERRKISEIIRNVLLFGRYQKLVNVYDSDDMTDLFYFPDIDETNYRVRNLQSGPSTGISGYKVPKFYSLYKWEENAWVELDGVKEDYESYEIEEQLPENGVDGIIYLVYESDAILDGSIYLRRVEYNPEYEVRENNAYYTKGDFINIEDQTFYVESIDNPNSYITVSGDIYHSNIDYMDFSKPTTFIWNGTIGSLENLGVVVGKIDPDKDRYYFDFRISADDETDDRKKGKSGSSKPDINSHKYIDSDDNSNKINDIIDGDLVISNIKYDSSLKDRRSNAYYQIGESFNITEGEETFSFKVSSVNNEHYLKFTMYSYDLDTEQGDDVFENYPLEDGKTELRNETEFKIVGHYSIKCYLDDSIKNEILNKEASYIFIYNGDSDNPKVDFYINTTKMNVVVDNFNFTGFPFFENRNAPEGDYTNVELADYYIRVKFYDSIRNACTIKNYTSFIETVPYDNPVIYGGHTIENYPRTKYYIVPNITTNSIMAFGKALTETEINYIALINRS